MANKRKAFTGALSGGLAAAPTANPYLIGGGALLGGVLGALSPERTFDPSPFREALKKYNLGISRSARRSAAEAGAQSAVGMAAQGQSASPMGQALIVAHRQRQLQKGEDQKNFAEGKLEADIATAEESIRQANEQEYRDDLKGVAQAGLALTDNISTQNSPLRAKLGLPEIPDPQAEALKALTESIKSGQGGDASVSLEIGSPATTTQTTLQKPFSTKLSYESPIEDINRMLNAKNINPNSPHWKAWHYNPHRMQELEDAFGSDFLGYIFSK